MFKRSSKQNPLALLPWYANHTLSATERDVVNAWLKSHPEVAPSLLAEVENIREAVGSHPHLSPSPVVRRRLLARLRGERQPRQLARSAWLIGSVVALVLLVTLWIVVQPGIALQWSVEGGSANAYRIYRAPSGSQDFQLLSEVPARTNLQSYSFIDITSLPGQMYTYVVEAVTENGQTSRSPLAIGSGWDVVPAQLALIMTSVIAGLAAMWLTAHSTQTVSNRRLIGV